MARLLPSLALASLIGLILTVAANPGLANDKKPGFHHLVEELEKVNHVLAKANPVYLGHRENAMDNIQNAILIFEKEGNLKNKVKKPAPNKKDDKNRTASDAHLRQAVKMLAGVQAQVAKLPNTPPNGQAAQNIRIAIGELEIALTLK